MNDLNSAKPMYFIHGMDIKDFRRVHEEEWKEKNEEGYDAFWCLQSFKGERRIKEELSELRYVVADFDNISNERFFSLWDNNPKPTFVVKTRSGFHAYWRLSAPTRGRDVAEEYKNFVGGKITPLGADANAKDVCRVLRVPSSRYWQDSKGNRYEDKEIYCEVAYDDGPEWEFNQLQRLFGSTKIPESTVRDKHRSDSTFGMGTRAATASNFWERANRLDVGDGLQKLSGSQWVSGESYVLKQEGKIKRIFINGKPSNAWVDEKGRIGSLHKNGSVPIAGTLVNWLMFPRYGHDMKAVSKIMKEVFNVAE